MVHRLLMAVAAVVAAAAAVGEYQMVLGGSCGCEGIQTYTTATAAYCPTSAYSRCDITGMVTNGCWISCPGSRTVLAYRNNSAIWLTTDRITCDNGVLKNGAGATLFNLQRPTCAYKSRCDECPAVAFQPNCPAGMTCKLYDASGAALANTATQLYCTVAKTWTNYSLDGSTVGGTVVSGTFTANCVLTKTCEQCVAPSIAVSLAQLPPPFRTGNEITLANYVHEANACAVASCPADFTLYGFSGNTQTVTGLEYTNKGFLKCDSTSHWTNGGMAYTPSNLVIACLRPIPPCKTCAQTLIAVTTEDPNSHPMDEDFTSAAGSCLVRTFKCVGNKAFINAWTAAGYIGYISDEGTGLATLPVTCNGTGWEAEGELVTRVECVTVPIPTCKDCAQNLITLITAQPAPPPFWVKPFDGDVTVKFTTCAERTLSCVGPSATIDAFKATGTTAGFVTDGGSGVAEMKLTCNGNATGWTYNGAIVTSAQCTVTPPCKACQQDLITLVQTDPNSKPMDEDSTVGTGSCLVRTFRCVDFGAYINAWEAAEYIGSVIDDGTGSASLPVTCNGTGWEIEGHIVTKVECVVPPAVTPCKSCAQNLITVTQADPNSKPMDGDSTTTTGACAVRTFTCTANGANIHVWTGAGNPIASVGDQGTGTATLSLTCNGTGWEIEGALVTQVECLSTPASNCNTCAQNLITIVTQSAGAKPFDTDQTVTWGLCAERTLTCVGPSATIDTFTAAGAITDQGSGASLVVTCNAAGTAWEYNGVAITEAQCSVTPPTEPSTTPAVPGECKSCTQNQITVAYVAETAKAFDGDVTVTSWTCAERTFTCAGPSATIDAYRINGSTIGTVTDGGSGVASLKVVCNAAGSGWEYNGAVVFGVQCYVTPSEPSTTPAVPGVCKNCTQTQVTVAYVAETAKAFDGDVTVTSGTCAERTFTCAGPSATIDAFRINGSTIGTVTDGGTGVASLKVICNAAGSGWEYNGAVVFGVQCYVTPAAAGCTQCADTQIEVTQTAPNSKPMDSVTNSLEDGCTVRTFKCIGAGASIAGYTANGYAGAKSDAGTGTAEMSVYCNSTGGGWDSGFGGGFLLRVECITSGETTTPAAGDCKSCTKNQISIVDDQASSPRLTVEFSEDVILTIGTCAERRFTCVGPSSGIDFFTSSGASAASVSDGGSGVATLTATCNANGSGWVYNGAVVTKARCTLLPPPS